MDNTSTETRLNKAYFFLGVFVTLVILGLAMLTSMMFWKQQAKTAALVTGENALNEIVNVDWSTFWRLNPNLSKHQVTEGLADDLGRMSTYSYSTNDLGFRSPPIKTPKPPLRILAIGDSTTFGQHLEDNETWPAQLQSLLDPEGNKVEVINAGVIGASSFQGLSFLITQGLALNPDLVIATFGFNDGAKADISDRERARLYSQRGILGMIRRAINNRSEKKATVLRATPGEYLDNLFFMAGICEKEKTPLLFLIWSNPWEVKDPVGNMSQYRPYLLEVCRTTSAECLDLQPAFAKANAPVFLDRIHGNALGCKITAETIADYVTEKFSDLLD